MPPALKDKVDTVRRYSNFVVDALTVVFVAFLSRRMSISPARMGLELIGWKSNALVGIAVGSAAVAIMGLILRKVPIDPTHDFTYRVRKGSSLLWPFIFMSASFAEELWIAFCLRALTYPAIVSVALIVVVFAAMHYTYRLWGVVAVAAKGTVSALLFLHFGSLVVTFLYHFTSNLGSLYWNRYWHQ